ncbi:MAG: hypothetical protein Roseis2KO_38080 [Roseivirga sp.]
MVPGFVLASLVQVEAEYDSAHWFDRFIFETESFWYWFLLLFLVLRTIVNFRIYQLTNSPWVREPGNDSLINVVDEMIPKTPEETESREQDKRQGPSGMADFEFLEFLTICVFTFWWNPELKEPLTLMRLKKLSNLFNILFIPLLIFTILFFYRLQ